MLSDGGNADGHKDAIGAYLQHAAGGQVTTAVPYHKPATRRDRGIVADQNTRGGHAVAPRSAYGGSRGQSGRIRARGFGWDP